MRDKLKWLGKKTVHILISFIIGVIIATLFHLAMTNHKIRTNAEHICEAFSRDERECKDGIDDVMNMADNEVQNNITIE